MKKVSTKNTYTDIHSGEKYTQQQIDHNTKKAKNKYREVQKMDYEMPINFCEKCSEIWEDEQIPPPNKMDYKLIDISHLKSVQQCKNDGEIEKIWDFRNIELLCRFHHIEFENSQKSLHFREL
jgi:hypothetical protein